MLDFILHMNVRGEACAGPGKERERCICIIAPFGVRPAAISSFDSFEIPVGEQQATEVKLKCRRRAPLQQSTRR